MAHKCFISFKTEDITYKNYIRDEIHIDMIDKSLDKPILSFDDEYIMKKIREDYLSDSTVTIFLIGTRSSENLGFHEQRYIKKELQASLYNGANNSKSGILGVVLPSMYDSIYKGSYNCTTCAGTHNYVGINDSTVIREFSHNYYIPAFNKCSWSEEDRYCILVKWNDFISNAESYIDQAYDKRTHPITNKTKVKP